MVDHPLPGESVIHASGFTSDEARRQQFLCLLLKSIAVVFLSGTEPAARSSSAAARRSSLFSDNIHCREASVERMRCTSSARGAAASAASSCPRSLRRGEAALVKRSRGSYVKAACVGPTTRAGVKTAGSSCSQRLQDSRLIAQS
jgi:hypothetical protein